MFCYSFFFYTSFKIFPFFSFIIWADDCSPLLQIGELDESEGPSEHSRIFHWTISHYSIAKSKRAKDSSRVCSRIDLLAVYFTNLQVGFQEWYSSIHSALKPNSDIRVTCTRRQEGTGFYLPLRVEFGEHYAVVWLNRINHRLLRIHRTNFVWTSANIRREARKAGSLDAPSYTSLASDRHTRERHLTET